MSGGTQHASLVVPKYVEQISPRPMEQSFFHPVVLLCVTQRKVSNIQPRVLREIGVDANNYKASPVCFAFR